MDPGTEARLKTDRILLLIFFVLLVVTTSLATLAYFVSGVESPDQLVGTLLGGFTFSFFGTGIYSYGKLHGSSLIPRKQITRWMLWISLALSAVTVVSLFIAFRVFSFPLDEEPFASPVEEAIAFAAIFFGGILAYFLVILFGAIAAFGAIGVMSAVERRLAPRVLRAIVGFGGKSRLTAEDHVVRWLFAIPDFIDTELLEVHPAPKRPFVRWRDMIPPVEWQMLFGAVIAMYASLNPFIAGGGGATIQSVFAILTNGAILIPFVILPWFALQRLGAGISGSKKDFTLYNGIRSRLIQTFFAVGTLLLLARVLISGTDIETFAAGFSSFMLMLLLVSLLCTFVYLNYFENDLVEDISKEFSASKPQAGTVDDERQTMTP